MNPYASHESVTLYLTERRAFEAAMRNATKTAKAFRVLRGTMRNRDGSMERGFKVLMVPKAGRGIPYYL